MNNQEYRQKIEEVLQAPLTTDSPETLYKEAAVIESLAYLSVKLQAKAEVKLSEAEAKLREKGSMIVDYEGTASDRKLKWEAEHAELFKNIDNAKTEVLYWRNVGQAIEKKVSLAQSILSNITSSIKAGIYLDSVK